MRIWLRPVTTLLMACASIHSFAQYIQVPEQRVVSVSGSADIKVKPDIITLSFGVETRGVDLEKAKSSNDQSVSNVIAFLKASKIEQKDIQTDFLSINPDYNNNSLAPDIYKILRTFTVTIHSQSLIEDLLTGSVKSGVNHVYGIDFRTSELKKYREQARDIAIKAAKEKAMKLAASLDVKLGEVYSITENSYGGYFSWHPGYGFQRNMGGSQMAVRANNGTESDNNSPTVIGEIPISASVSVNFYIK